MKKQCSYCEATTNPKESLTDQGWTAVVMHIGSGKNHKRFHGRACPRHHADLMADANKFFAENRKIKASEKPQGCS